MSGSKITQLPSTTSLAITDLIPVVTGSATTPQTDKITVQSFFANAPTWIYNPNSFLVVDANGSLYLRSAGSPCTVEIADDNNANIILAAGGGNVGIGAAPSSKLYVNGITFTDKLGVGNMPDANSHVLFASVYDATTYQHGELVQTYFSPSATSPFIGFGVEIDTYKEGNQNMGYLVGVQSDIYALSASGAISSMTSFSSATGAISSTGTVITDATGFLANAPYVDSGSISNTFGVHINNQGNARVTSAYGLLIENQAGASYSNYSIYTNAGKVHLGDDTNISGSLTVQRKLGIGTTAPQWQLHIDTGSDPYGPQIAISSGTPSVNNQAFYIGYDNSADHAFLQSIHAGTGYTPIILQSQSGRVGIGTTSPSATLHIHDIYDNVGLEVDAVSGATAVILKTDTVNPNSAILWRNQNDVTQSAIGSNYNIADANGNLEFMTNGTTLRMLIDGAGDVYTTQGNYDIQWTASGTAPAIGNGTLSGFYHKLGKKVTVNIYWASGSTTTFGTGYYYFSLPFTARVGNERAVGSWFGFNGGNYFTGVVNHLTGGNVISAYTNSGEVTNTIPTTWVSGDYMWMSITYIEA